MNKLILIALIALSGCSSTITSNSYKVGNISKAYCASTDVEFRNTLKVLIQKATGKSLPVDYCFSVNLIDALAG